MSLYESLHTDGIEMPYESRMVYVGARLAYCLTHEPEVPMVLASAGPADKAMASPSGVDAWGTVQ